MKHAYVFAFLFAGLLDTAHAFRVMEPLEDSVEIALRDLRLPSDATGSVSFRVCGTCPLSSHRLTEESSFVLNKRVLPYSEFLVAIEEIRASESRLGRALTGVFLDIETRRVTRVIVHVSSAP